MHRRRYLSALGVAALGVVAGCTGSDDDGGDTDGADGDAPDDSPGYAVETVAEGFAYPWGIAPLSDGRLLVTERVGDLRLVDPETGTAERVPGTPTVYAEGQGGLLDVALHPEFPDERWVYLTYSATDDTGASATHLGRGRLDRAADRLREFETVHVAEPFVESSGHFGSRVAFRDGDAYVTVGDRQFKNFGPDHVAQDRTNELGTTLRLRPDGSVPEDNPFVDEPGVRSTIYTYGNRNAQGLAVHPDGTLYQSEFGERDGDELNVLRGGANYGWPVADESCEYGSDEPVGVSHADRSDVVAPVYSWPCGSGGFPPSGMTVYDGTASGWRGDLFVGGLASRALARFTVDAGGDRPTLTLAETLLGDREWRVRDVTMGPDAEALYVAVDDPEAPLARLVPA